MDWKLEVVHRPRQRRGAGGLRGQAGVHPRHRPPRGQDLPGDPGDAARLGLLDRVRDRPGRRRQPGSLKGCQLAVTDIEEAHRQLEAAGIDNTGPAALRRGRRDDPRPRAEPRRLRHLRLLHDPDGNGWTVQEMKQVARAGDDEARGGLRPAPARAARALLPDARVVRRRRGRRAGDAAAGVAGRDSFDGEHVAGLALPDRDQRLPRRDPRARRRRAPESLRRGAVAAAVPGSDARRAAPPDEPDAARRRETIELAYLAAMQVLPGAPARGAARPRRARPGRRPRRPALLETTRRRGQQCAAAGAGDDAGAPAPRSAPTGRAGAPRARTSAAARAVHRRPRAVRRRRGRGHRRAGHPDHDAAATRRFDGHRRDRAAAGAGVRRGPGGDWRLCRPRPTGCRPQPATCAAGGHAFRAFKFDVLRVDGGEIAEITTFGPDMFVANGMPETLATTSRSVPRAAGPPRPDRASPRSRRPPAAPRQEVGVGQQPLDRGPHRRRGHLGRAAGSARHRLALRPRRYGTGRRPAAGRAGAARGPVHPGRCPEPPCETTAEQRSRHRRAGRPTFPPARGRAARQAPRVDIRGPTATRTGPASAATPATTSPSRSVRFWTGAEA